MQHYKSVKHGWHAASAIDSGSAQQTDLIKKSNF